MSLCRAPSRPLRRVLIQALLALSPWLVQAQTVPAPAGEWASLSAQQRQVLAPLERDWSSLDASRRQKWLEIAARYPTMNADQRERMQRRMSEWSRLTPEQRGQARINFQQARQTSAQDRQAQWEAYQALPDEQKQALAQRQQRDKPASPPPTSTLRKAPLDAQAPKVNSLPPQAATAAPRAIGPTLVQAGPGASTRLINQAPTKVGPAASAPRPKIEVSPQVVDPTTLLPKREQRQAERKAQRKAERAGDAPAASAPISAPPASAP